MTLSEYEELISIKKKYEEFIKKAPEVSIWYSETHPVVTGYTNGATHISYKSTTKVLECDEVINNLVQLNTEMRKELDVCYQRIESQKEELDSLKSKYKVSIEELSKMDLFSLIAWKFKHR